MPALLACHDVAQNIRDGAGVRGKLKEYIFLKYCCDGNCLFVYMQGSANFFLKGV